MLTNAKQGVFRALMLFGIGLMTVSGQRLGFKTGVSWEFAGFALGILMSTNATTFLLVARIAELERKVSSLIDASAHRQGSTDQQGGV
jgi:predicted cobalt transporter CbtA